MLVLQGLFFATLRQNDSERSRFKAEDVSGVVTPLLRQEFRTLRFHGQRCDPDTQGPSAHEDCRDIEQRKVGRPLTPVPGPGRTHTRTQTRSSARQ